MRPVRRTRRAVGASVAASVAAGVAAGVLATGAAASPAWADPWGHPAHPGVVTPPTPNPHRYCFTQLPSVARGPILRTNAYVHEATNAVTKFEPSCVLSPHGSTTDVRWTSGDLPGFRGQFRCDVLQSTLHWFSGYNICDRGTATLDLAELANSGPGASYVTNIEKTACHENGHSMGLQHYKTAAVPNPPAGQHDCMLSGSVPTTDPGWLAYGAHHKDHIDHHAFP